ncbi:HAD family hydrolase [Alicyclobacillus sp. SO9]|uniref:HAD family hydrolase n=1 Tax=Alicyclobacillus sp. SO9 TaxID=2665646 RepID=UPI0018E7D964|nr:HAD family hydrolase [Alicyclobacillus sp. SO9]QQE79016.1 HAD family hydrolase [Alicyclobacillus sp. SO9]
MTKLFAIDLDGTLLGSNHDLSEQSRRVIREVLLRGYYVTLVTGRISRSARLYARFLGIDGPLICLNGANVVDAGSGELMYGQPMEERSVKRLLRMAESMQIPYLLYGQHYLITNVENEVSRRWRLRSMVRPAGFSGSSTGQWQHVPLLVQSADNLSEAVYKVSLECSSESIQQEVLAQVKGLENLCVKLADPWRVHFTNHGVHKLHALHYLRGLLNISLDDIVAFGNADNDLEMLTGVGYGVAVGNATETIRNSVDIHAASNDELGVANKILEIIERESGSSVSYSI